MTPRHLEPRRPRKDRDVTWSRSSRPGGVMWTFWRRDRNRAIHMRMLSRGDREVFDPRILFREWRRLRDFVDEIDLTLMEKIA